MITTAHAHISGVIFLFFPRAFKQKKNEGSTTKDDENSLKGGPALRHIQLSWTDDFWVLALPLVVAPPNLQNQLTLTSEGALNYHGFERSLQTASVGGDRGARKVQPGKVSLQERLDH